MSAERRTMAAKGEEYMRKYEPSPKTRKYINAMLASFDRSDPPDQTHAKAYASVLLAGQRVIASASSNATRDQEKQVSE